MPFFTRHKPVWLYESLPALYVLAGLAVAVHQRATLGYVCGALVAGTGLLIAGTRFVKRRQAFQRALDDTPSVLVELPRRPRRPGVAMPPVLGHPDLDRQHRQLAAQSAALRQALSSGASAADVELLVHELVDQLGVHFASEQRTLAQLRVPEAPAMAAQHRAALAAIEAALKSFHAAGLALPALVDAVAVRVVDPHVHGAHPPLPSIESALQQLRAHAEAH